MSDHQSHSSLVRHWRKRDKHSMSWMSNEAMRWEEGPTHTLRSPHEGHLVQVSFTPYRDHPGHVRIRSTNWRAEHEPNGIYAVDDAREFYATLRAAGFAAVVREPEEVG